MKYLYTFDFMLIEISMLAIIIAAIYFYDSFTIKVETDSHGHEKVKSVIDERRNALRIIIGVITLIHVLLTLIVIASVGFSIDLLPVFISSHLWIGYFRLWNREVNANKIAIIMSNIINKSLREEREGPTVLIPFNQRPTINERGDAHLEEISDKLIPRTLRVQLRTAEGKGYTGVFTFWVKWTVGRSREIREYAGGQAGLLAEIDKYVISEAQKVASKKSCWQTLAQMKYITEEIQRNIHKIVGNADEREPISISDKKFVMERENDKEVMDYLKSDALEKLVDAKMKANLEMSRESAREAVYLEQGITSKSIFNTSGSGGSVIVSTDKKFP